MTRRSLRFSRVPGQFAVCQLPANAPLPAWAWSGPVVSVTRTADEVSIVCFADNVPANVKSTRPWVCFALEGPFPFSEVGILAAFIDPLAENGVPIMAISTFDTDYVLVNEHRAALALQVLQDAGHELLS